MIVSRWTPVIRSVDLIEDPSTRAPTTACCFSFFRTLGIVENLWGQLG